MSSASCLLWFVILCLSAKADILEDDYRVINRQDLLATNSDVFQDNSTTSFSQLLFDVGRDQLIVGARDAIYRLSLKELKILEKSDVPAPVEKARLCQMKGQTEEDCHNYIKILLSYGHKLFACGTEAFSPRCSWRNLESVGSVLGWEDGVAKCPYSPAANVTAIISSTGEYYVGTPADFAGSVTAIYRSQGSAASPSQSLRTNPFESNWLNQPQFVGSFEDDKFIYFVFREVAVEFMNCGKIIYSRIARVCKNDAGGFVVKKENWSTYLKARLNCSHPGEYPFYYDEVQSITYLADERLLIATFTTPINSIAGSAICVYNMSEVELVFNGPYQRNPGSGEPKHSMQQARDHFNCVQDRLHPFFEYDRYQLTRELAKPIQGKPVYEETLQRLSHVTVDITATRNTNRQFVMYVATQDHNIMKLSVEPGFSGACMVELWKLNDGHNEFLIQNLQFVKETMSVYVGGAGGIWRVGVARCARYATRAACVGAADPYCGWLDGRDLCVHTGHIADQFFYQSRKYCPMLDMSVDGGWSSWSEWEDCMQHSDNPASGTKSDLCKCRTRRCDNPKPTNSGLPCDGASIAVSNCTVHGAWTEWSEWSACSAACGAGMRRRTRACSGPTPQHGGRHCLGAHQQEERCLAPPCPDPTEAPIDGSWSAWGEWGSCDAALGGAGCGAGAGWRQRRRSCSAPAPARGGRPCAGAAAEREPCDLRPCDSRRAAAWTPWVQLQGNSTDGSYTEKRFKFMCKAQTADQIKLSLSKEEYRYCNSRGVCGTQPWAPDDEGWGPWGEWGPCSASCGSGHQVRTRHCREPACAGTSDMLRQCNTHACTGEWSCWSDWGPCSGQCGSEGPRAGVSTRTRSCLSVEGCADAGAALERRVCLPSCSEEGAGWGEWGEWGECGASGERVRTRRCQRGACYGPQMQVAMCRDDDDIDNELNALPAYTQNIEMASFVKSFDDKSLGVGGIVGCVLAAFLIGCVSTLGGVIYCSRRSYGGRLSWRRPPKVPSSPHYITAKQNSYVTVPLKDVPRKPKRQPSFTGISNGGGLVPAKSNNLSNANNQNTLTTPKLYPKAIANEYESMGTLKRNSNHNHTKNHFDFEEDKFY